MVEQTEALRALSNFSMFMLLGKGYSWDMGLTPQIPALGVKTH